MGGGFRQLAACGQQASAAPRPAGNKPTPAGHYQESGFTLLATFPNVRSIEQVTTAPFHQKANDSCFELLPHQKKRNTKKKHGGRLMN